MAVAFLALSAPASAQTPPAGSSGATIDINIGNSGGKPGESLLIVLLLTLLAISPALLIMLTSFTRIIVVLSLIRNALGLQAVPPNQVLVGLALFLTLFVMQPTLSQVNEDALQPYLAGKKTTRQALDAAQVPLHRFMLRQTGKRELALFVKTTRQKPSRPEKVTMTALVPAFILSELRTAFIIGFVIFIPFLVIDMVVSSTLMSMGMMMLPPILVSLPFKLLLFVMVNGWTLIVSSLLSSFH